MTCKGKLLGSLLCAVNETLLPLSDPARTSQILTMLFSSTTTQQKAKLDPHATQDCESGHRLITRRGKMFQEETQSLSSLFGEKKKKNAEKHVHNPQPENSQNEWNNCVSNSHTQRKRPNAGDTSGQTDMLRALCYQRHRTKVTSLCLKWSCSSSWPRITFYLLDMAHRTLDNLAPTWPRLLWILLGSLPPLLATPHPDLTSFHSLPQTHCTSSYFPAPVEVSTETVFPSSLMIKHLPLIQMQLKCHPSPPSLAVS